MPPSSSDGPAGQRRDGSPPAPSARQRLLRQQRHLVSLEPRFLGLLLTTLLPVLLLPLTANRTGPSAWLVPLLYSLLIQQSIRTLPVLRPSPGAMTLVRAYRLLGVLAAGGLWLPVLTGGWPIPGVRLVVLLLCTIFAVATSIRLVRLLARVPRVNVLVMAGAAAGYLYLGLTGGLVATAIQVLHRGSFSLGSDASHELLLDRLTYFSFVTIGGLGYGDIVPTNATGERFVVLLSVASTLYVVLLVGLLLGRFIATEELEFELEALVDEAEDPTTPLGARLATNDERTGTDRSPDQPGPRDP
ncbi:ion channel [Vulcanococcus limneticus]|uniref:ion channel n=1 Tax=Vulcanococcus limneticus TaxID=2170428 RepID=UPI00398BC174